MILKLYIVDFELGGTLSLDNFQELVPAGKELEKGRVRFLTILSADMVGSTAALEDLDAEDAREILYKGVRLMTGAIRAAGGIIVSVQGDGVLAVFGSEIAREDDTERCCYAGLEILERFQTPIGVAGAAKTIGVRIGIHAGEVFLHRSFSDHGSWLDVTGYPVHVAAKIQQSTAANSVSISLDAMPLLKGPVTTAETRSVQMSGTNKPIGFCSVISITSGASDLAGDLQLVETPIVGREEHLDTIKRSLSASDGGLRRHLFEGVAGVGKTRLSAEVRKIAEGLDVQTVYIKGEHSSRNTSYSALIPMITSVLDLQLPVSREQLEKALMGTAIPREYLNGLQDVLNVSGLDRAYANERSSVRYAATMKAILSVLKYAASRAGKILILVEDVDQLDEFTLAALLEIETVFAHEPIVMVASSRPDDGKRMGMFGGVVEVLETLDSVSARKIVTNLLGEAAANRKIVDDIVAVAQGVPLMLRAYAQTYKSSVEGKSNTIPLDLRASTQLRLQRLSEPAKKLMDFLSVSPDGLEREVCEYLFEADAILDESLSELFASGLAKRGSERFLALQHALLGQASDAIMLKADKRAVHHELWQALQATATEPLPLDRLAHHADAAGDYDEALRYYWSACKREVQRSSLPAITEIFQKVSDVCRKVGEQADESYARFALLTFDSFQQRGLMSELSDRMNTVVGIARAHKSVLFECQALAHGAMVDWFHARHADAYEKASDAKSLAKSNKIEPIVAYAQYMMASAKQGAGEIKSAIALHAELIENIDRNPELLKSMGIRNTVFVSHSLAVWCMAQSGEFERAERVLSRAQLLAVDSNYPFGDVMLSAARGLLNQVQGKYADAAIAFEECVRLCRQETVSAMEARAVAGLAQCKTRLGDPSASLALIEDAYKRKIETICGKCCIVSLHIAHAEALVELQEPAAAMRAAEMAVDFAVDINEPTSEMLALLTRGDVVMSIGGAVELAHESYAAALTIASQRGFAPAKQFASAALSRMTDSQSGPIVNQIGFHDAV